MDQLPRMLFAPSEDQGLISSTYRAAHNHLYFQTQGIGCLSLASVDTTHMFTDTCQQTSHTHRIDN